MSNPSELLFYVLQRELYAARQHTEAVRSRNAKGVLIQVPKTGKRLASAYEHFRNAAEYTEEHLLLQRAIRRFYMRNLFYAKSQVDDMGEELVIELTHAGYLKNNSVSTETITIIRRTIKKYVRAYNSLRRASVEREQAMRWVLEVLSVETEEIINPHGHLVAITYTAYEHFLRLLPRKKLSLTTDENKQYEVSLYIAVHLALLKSDSAVIRHDLMKMHRRDPQDTSDFIDFNQSLDAVLGSPFVQRLKRAVSKFGAPLRVLKEMSEDRPDLPELLDNRDAFLTAYNQQIAQEYRRVSHRLNNGITKSVAFLFISKIIIGVAIEIPYDLFVIGYVALLPLAINLLFPPLYIASLRFLVRLPSRSNAAALQDAIDKTLYSHKPPAYSDIRLGVRRISVPARIIYTLLFFVPVAVIILTLQALNFNIVQGIIFFIFLSTASFLGFRLSRIIRELEIVTKQGSLLSSLADFFYLPFIIIGQWLSSKYSQVNATALFLDMAIEMPLKTTLRLLRQWTRFLNDRRDEIV